MSLTSDQVLEIRKTTGWNEMVSSKRESRFQTIRHVFKDPMGLMLLGLGFIYLLVGKTNDAIVLFLSFIPVSAVDVLLELKAKKAMSSLRASLRPMAKVIRNRVIVEIAIREIVPGDTIVFEEGQSLPADGSIVECEQVEINEASLTGESIPVEKGIGSPFFGGTVILQGRGLGLVEKIAKETLIGKIAKLIEETDLESSPLKKKINSIVKKVFLVAMALAIVLFCLTYFENHNFIESLIESLTFGMAAIPEEFPLVFTLYLSMGAYRLSRHGVLVKSLPSVEALGGVDVICTDKTGTLTEGKFQLEFLLPIETKEIKQSDLVMWQSALMACEEKAVDAMEMAMFEKGRNYMSELNDWRLMWDYPFEIKGKHMSHVWKNQKTNQTIIAMKGAVEGVLEHCNLDKTGKEKNMTEVNLWASKGKRLLGFARREGTCTGERVQDERGLEFLGLLIFSDPIRASAKNAVFKCQEAGITVKMLTGDHPLTAHAVADELNLTHSHDFLYTGNELSLMTKEERWLAYQRGAIFSRVLPEQKYEMVQSLKSLGKVVAMTGDGINDAPALKTADIGISMGENATDVARNSAQMILMKNDFQGIVEAIFEGRKIFSNLKRSFSYLISFHIPILIFALVPPLMGHGTLLLPIHIVLLELIVHPVSAFSFENLPAEIEVNKKMIISPRRFFESLLSGLILSLGSLFLFNHFAHMFGVDLARSIAIAAIMFGNIFFVLVESFPKLTIRFLLTGIMLLDFLLLVLYINPIADIFYLKALPLNLLAMSLIVGLCSSIPTFLLRHKILLKKNFGVKS